MKKRKTLRKEKYIKIKYAPTATYITVQFYYETVDGKKMYSKTFTSTNYESEAKALDAACEHRDKMRANMIAGELAAKPRTVDQCFDDFIKVMHVSVGNAKTLSKEYKLYIQEDFGFREIRSITSYDVQTCLNSLVETKTECTLKQVMTIWRHIFRVAILENIITRSPMERVIMPKSKVVHVVRPQSYNDEDLNKLLDHFHNMKGSLKTKYNGRITEGMLRLIALTGIRPAECRAIKRENIDLNNKILNITHALGSTAKGANIVVPTKTPNSRRSIPLTDEAIEVLKSIMSMSENEYIFTLFDGNLPNNDYFSCKINNACKVLEIEKFHVYALRHRFATKMITSGIDPATVMSLMGHTGSSMTLSYTRATDEEKKRKAMVEIGRKLDIEAPKQ